MATLLAAILAALAVLSGLLASPAAAEGRDPPALVLVPGEPGGDLAPHVSVYSDASRTLTLSDMLSGTGQALFQPLERDGIDLGYSPARFWLRADLANPHDEPWQGYLVMHTRFMTDLNIHRVSGDGPPARIFRDTWRTPYTEREIPYIHLATPFTLGPGERVTLIADWRSYGSSSMPTSLENEASFASLRSAGRLQAAVIFTVWACVIVFTLSANAAMRWPVHLAYCAYFTVAVAYVLHMDGFLFPLLWPFAPEWNSYASLALGYGIACFAPVFSTLFLNLPEHNPRLHRLLLAIAGFTALIVLFGWLFDTRSIKQFGFVYNTVAVLVCLYAGLVAFRRGHPGVVFYLLAWLSLLVMGILSIGVHWIKAIAPVSTSADYVSYGIVFEAAMFALAINAQMTVLRRDKDRATRNEIAALRGKLDAEKQRAYAIAMAQAWREQLATASHDIKQPLFSLRLALDRLSRSLPAARARDIAASFTYLEGLIGRLLDDASEARGHLRPPAAEPPDAFPAASLVDNAKRMFAADAAEKGLRLDTVDTSLSARGDSMSAMRIVANLVSNAIRFTDEGRILIGARRRGAHVAIEVWDQGPGLAPEELRRLLRAYEKGETSTGHGLGLSIAVALAREHGFELAARSWPGRGSCFSVLLPRAMPADSPTRAAVQA